MAKPKIDSDLDLPEVEANLDQQVDEMDPVIMADDLVEQDLTDLGTAEVVKDEGEVTALPDALEEEALDVYADNLVEAEELESLYHADDDSDADDSEEE